MHRAPEVPYSFAVDDAEPEDSSFTARLEVLGDKVFDLLRTKGVEVQDAVDRQLDRGLTFRTGVVLGIVGHTKADASLP